MTFGSQSTTDEVLAGIDLRGKRVLVTGASSGLGVETARALQARGADVIGAVRDIEKARVSTTGLTSAGSQAGFFDLVELDLSSLASVRRCANALLADARSFDIVIANAGVMATPLGRTSEGFETQFGTNHLGHFVLVNRIASLFAHKARLVVVSSAGHRYGDVDLADPNFEGRAYDPWTAYSQSKTANILFAVEFDRRHKANRVRASAVHPRVIRTELGRHMDPEVEAAQIAAINQANADAGLPPFEYKTIAQGAATSVWAAVAEADLSAPATAKTATSPRRMTVPASSAASSPTRWMRSARRRCGRQARRWSARPLPPSRPRKARPAGSFSSAAWRR